MVRACQPTRGDGEVPLVKATALNVTENRAWAGIKVLLAGRG